MNDSNTNKLNSPTDVEELKRADHFDCADADTRAKTRADQLAKLYNGERFSHIGWVANTGSTNDDLIEIAKSTDGNRVLIADHQSAGRARRNRIWIAPAQSSLLMSVLLKQCELNAFWAVASVALAAQQSANQILQPATANPPAATVKARPAVTSEPAATSETAATSEPAAVSETGGFGQPVTLKWPNDLVIEDRKLAGVLAARRDDVIVVGIGINVNRPITIPPEIKDRASWLNEYLQMNRAQNEPGPSPIDGAVPDVLEVPDVPGGEPAELDRVELAAHILNRLDTLISTEVSELRDMWKTHCSTLGQFVRIEEGNGDRRLGVAVDVEMSGALILEGHSGRSVHHVGDVVHLRRG